MPHRGRRLGGPSRWLVQIGHTLIPPVLVGNEPFAHTIPLSAADHRQLSRGGCQKKDVLAPEPRWRCRHDITPAPPHSRLGPPAPFSPRLGRNRQNAHHHRPRGRPPRRRPRPRHPHAQPARADQARAEPGHRHLQVHVAGDAGTGVRRRAVPVHVHAGRHSG